MLTRSSAVVIIMNNRLDKLTPEQRVTTCLEILETEFIELQKQKAALVDRIRNQPHPTDNNSLVYMLRSALANTPGWREKARQMLGDYDLLTCRDCGASFPSGSKQRKRCAKCTAK